MSFLQEQLQQKRSTLNAATTTVTTCTGERYIESSTAHGPPAVRLERRAYGFVVDTSPDAVPACILADFLYLGSQDAVTGHNVAAYQLTHILSVGVETPAHDVATDVRQVYLPCLDLPDTQLAQLGVIAKAVAFIEAARTARGRVLVHCNAGVSRSASLVMAYLMQAQAFTFDAAYALVKSKRPCVQPNAGFLKQLRALQSPPDITTSSTTATSTTTAPTSSATTAASTTTAPTSSTTTATSTTMAPTNNTTTASTTTMAPTSSTTTATSTTTAPISSTTTASTTIMAPTSSTTTATSMATTTQSTINQVI